MIYQYEERMSTRDTQIPIIMGSGKDDDIVIPEKDHSEDIPEAEFENGKFHCCEI